MLTGLAVSAYFIGGAIALTIAAIIDDWRARHE